MPETNTYYIFNPNNGKFISGPFTCKNWAKVTMRSIQPQAGAPENESYVIVELNKNDIMQKKVSFTSKSI